MKKLFAMLLSVVMLFTMAACGSAGNEVKAEGPKEYPPLTAEEIASIETVEPGVLTVATSPDFAPYEFYAIDENGTPSLAGFDLALAQAIADYLNLELEIVPMDFDGVLMEVGLGSVDIGLAGLSPDPDRMDAMDFSDPYYFGGQSFVCLESNKDQFQSMADANKADYSIGAQTASIQLDLANENTPDADIISLPKVTDIIAELLSGKLDGAFIETAVAESYKLNYPDLCIALDVPYDEAPGSCVGVSKGNELLLRGVNETIEQVLEDGSMGKFIEEANELASGETFEGLLEEPVEEE